MHIRLLHTKKINLVLLWGFIALLHSHTYAQTITPFIENKGQLPEQVYFKTELNAGNVYFEKSGITFDLFNRQSLLEHHNEKGHRHEFDEKRHVVKLKYLNINSKSQLIKKGESSDYKNYFIGKDKSKWASNVHSYSGFIRKHIYTNIDLKYYTNNEHLKYDFIVHPGGNPADIQWEFDGADSLNVVNGSLRIYSTVTEIIDSKPKAFQILNNKKVPVNCSYYVENNKVKFIVGEYDKSMPLIIDPILVFSSFTGSSANNFGFTATYGYDGSLFGGGIVFPGGQYPVTTGAYQTAITANSGSGKTDIGITRYSPDGTSLIYSTYIGGTNAEAPHSLVVNQNNELFILGTTGSADYPTTTNAAQSNFAGGSNITPNAGSAITYDQGCDMIVTKLSADGTSLLGSTFMGGSGNDGLNLATTLNHNYGDAFRGEIIVNDNTGEVIAVSTTASNDFPTTPGAPQQNFGQGNYDAVVFRMNSALTTLSWSTYFGGNDGESGCGVAVNNAGEVFITGGTKSSIATTGGVINISPLGGGDGYLVRYNSAGNQILSTTYIGTPAYDQCYFVQLDNNGDVYVVGQTLGNYPISGGVYSNPSSGQFIQKISPDFTTSLFSTRIGSGQGRIDIAISAFLVNDCGQIYISGWGGVTNQSSLSNQSTTVGLPTTSDAFQSSTDGSDFYLMMLEQNAQSLIYATFFGGVSNEHVDGGTSRFDKQGRVYQAVCAGCPGNSDFPTTPGAWSATNGASCNLGVFKFELDVILAEADFDVDLSNCNPPVMVDFDNTSTGGTDYFWDYGDGSTSSDFEESHGYSQPGTYDVMLIVIDSSICAIADTAYYQVTIPPPPSVSVLPGDTVCDGGSVQLGAEGGVSYQWSPGSYLDNPTAQYPTATIDETTMFNVSITDSNGCVTVLSTLAYTFPPPNMDAGNDQILGFDNQVFLFPSLPGNIVSYQWTPPDGLSCTDCPNPQVEVDENTTYYLLVEDIYGCQSTDSVHITVTPALYVPNSFTPNDDSRNDVWYVKGTGINTVEIYIFNRWGEQIFYSDDLYVGWDGYYEGDKAPLDVYVWYVKYTGFVDEDEVYTKRGHVTLVR